MSGHRHPKRCPAHLTACLRPSPSVLHRHHSPPRHEDRADRRPQIAVLNPPAVGTANRMEKPIPGNRRRSSDVSDSPEEWFEDSNKNVSNRSGLFVDGLFSDPALFTAAAKRKQKIPHSTSMKLLLLIMTVLALSHLVPPIIDKYTRDIGLSLSDQVYHRWIRAGAITKTSGVSLTT